MEQFARILLIAMPIFLLLVILEKFYGIWKNNDKSPIRDTISSLCSGLTHVVKDVLGISFSILSYQYLVENLAITHFQNTIVVCSIAFITIDFYGYWSHRLQHRFNILWNIHVIHHSSEEFNLACALRQTISSFFNIFVFLLIPAAFLGIPSEVITLILPLHLFMQFWYHTQHIDKMGVLEKIIVTPSHHRVHHAVNKEYLDKNLGQIFIFWDKIFGTFQEELPDVKPIYGVTRPANTWNPIKINFQHLFLLIKDAWRSPKVVDKFKIWFMPTGWRPDNFDELYPVDKMDDVYSYKKYNSIDSKSLTLYSMFQLSCCIFFVLHLFYTIAFVSNFDSYPSLLLYGFFVFLHIYCLTDLMDANRLNWFFELLKMVLILIIIYLFDGWFNIDLYYSYLIVLYQLGSLAFSFYFSFIFNKNEVFSVTK